MSPHPKDSLFTSQRSSSPGPEENVGLSTGDDGVRVSGVELHSQDHLVSGLKHTSFTQSDTIQRPVRTSQTQSDPVRPNQNKSDPVTTDQRPVTASQGPVRTSKKPSRTS